MSNTRTVFVIRRSGCTGGEYCDYAEHGEMGGVPDAIGYDQTAHARKFRTAEAAQSFIDRKLPEWGRDCHHVAAVTAYELFFGAPALSCAMCADLEIRDDLLEPTDNRLRIWRR